MATIHTLDYCFDPHYLIWNYGGHKYNWLPKVVFVLELWRMWLKKERGGEVIGGRRVEISDPLGNGAGWQRGRKWWMRGEGREIVAGRRRSTEAADGRSRVGRGESLMGRAGILISKWGEEQRVRYSYVAIKHCMMYWGLGVVYLKLP